MKSPVKEGGAALSRPRGRPRSEEARRAILAAARALVEEGGLGAVTMEGVAARAGVGKPTVYRWWPDRHAVVMAALMDESPPVPVPEGAALAALRQQLRAIAARFGTPTGRHVTAMLATSDPESELSRAFRTHFLLARRDEGRALLAQAIAAGELRANLDLEIVLDLLYGAIFARLLLGHAPLHEEFVDRALAHVLSF